MNSKSNGHLRSSLTSKNRPNLDRFEVSVDKIKYKASKMMTSTDGPRNTKSKDQNSHNKSKEKSKSHLKQTKQKSKSKPKKKEGKLRNKRSYDTNIVRNSDDTYNNTERRKSSLKKHHQTQIQEYLEPESELMKLQIELLKVPNPKDNISEIQTYYQSLLKILSEVEEKRLYDLLINLHKAYTTPALEIFELVQPYESLLIKRREINFQVQDQFQKNQKLFEKLSNSQISQQINRLHYIVQEQRKDIQDLKADREQSVNRLQTIMFEQSSKDMFKKKDIPKRNLQQQQQPNQQIKHFRGIHDLQSPKPVEIPKELNNFKIDLSLLRDSKPIGYHEQFMSKLPEMSQSWREQALRQKRY